MKNMDKRKSVREILENNLDGNETVLACGWIKSVRAGKNVTFIALNDGSCLASLQLVMEHGPHNEKERGKMLTGTALKARGVIVPSPARGQKMEMQVSSVEITGMSDSSYPLQKKRHSFEFLRNIAHLRARSNTFGAVFRTRSRLTFAIHSFFQERGFVHLHSPVITANDCEGAGEMFYVTSQDPAETCQTDEPGSFWKRDFFRTRTGLTVSGQLEGEIFASAFGNIYTFGPTFRAENSNTSRHAAEFWMIEPEMAFADLDDDCELAAEFISFLVKYLLEHCQEDMEFFDRFIEKGIIERLEAIAENRFERMTYTEAVERLEKSGKSFEFPVEWGADLQSEHERYLTEEITGCPLFVTDYPAEIKAFYMRVNPDNRTVAAMDLLVPGIGEIIGGSQREERHDMLEKQMKAKGIRPDDLWWYMDLRRWGSCPHAGFGLGFERLLMYVTGMKNIRDVIPFPRTPGNAGF
jgi:asparaginyl-tRNA synthetase